MTEAKKQVHPLDQMIMDVDKLCESIVPSKEASLEEKTQEVLDSVVHDVAPLIRRLGHLLAQFASHQHGVNSELRTELPAKFAAIEASFVTVDQRLGELEAVDDFETRLIPEHASILTEFVKASMALITRHVPPGEEQQAIITRGNEILALVQENTLEEDDEEEEDGGEDDDAE